MSDVEGFLEQLASIVPDIASHADEDDAAPSFPIRALDLLRDIGALAAPLPPAFGGLDLGCDRQGPPTVAFMRRLGQASIAVARLLEGHLNALRLVFVYGNEDQRTRAAADARAGVLFGLWVTDGDAPLAIVGAADNPTLRGGKAFCSGAGHVARALVTADDPGRGPVMLLVAPDPNAAVGRGRHLMGVRSAVTADMAFDGIRVDDAMRIGAPHDYLRRPEFLAGAWRGSAIASGALHALVSDSVAQLVARHRHTHPAQAARIGRMTIAAETARLWVERVAAVVDRGAAIEAGDVANMVNLGRIAVEAACLEAMQDAQRALGLGGLMRGNRVERLQRDLMTYLRQPAPDETLHDGAVWFATRTLP